MSIKGLPYDLVPVFPGSNDEAFRVISPLGKIPGYTDGDFAISDTSVICAYLEKLNPTPPLYPSDPETFARALWLEEYADTKLAESIGPKIFFHRVVNKKMMGKEIDETKVQRAIDEDLPPVFDYVESVVGDNDFAVGGTLTISDLSLATHFVNLNHAGETVDAKRWPKIVAYLEKHHGSPYFKQLIEEESAQLG